MPKIIRFHETGSADVLKIEDNTWKTPNSPRGSVQQAVSEDYAVRLLQFFAGKDSVIGDIARQALADIQQAVA